MRPFVEQIEIPDTNPVRKTKTLVAPNGDLLRGDSLLAFRSNWGKEIIDTDFGDNHEKWTNGECRNKAYYRKLQALGLNCVRMFVYRDIRKEYKNNWFDWTEIVPVIDDVVTLCAEFNLTLLLDYHPVPCGKANFSTIDPTTNNEDDAWLPENLTSFAQDSKDFWSFVAPKYKDSEHVVYEIQNEPFQWSTTYLDKYYADQDAIAYQGEMYTLVRNLAPDTPLVMWSFPQARGYTTAKRDLLDIVRRDKLVKYKNAVVGFHAYAMDKNSVIRLAEKKPAFMTEFSDQSNPVKSLASYQKFIDFFEDERISWIMLNLIWAMRKLPGETFYIQVGQREMNKLQ